MAVPEVTPDGSFRYFCARLSTVQDVQYVGVQTLPMGNLCYSEIFFILDTIIDLFPLLIDGWKISQSGETDSKPHKADNLGELKLHRQKETGGFRFS